MLRALPISLGLGLAMLSASSGSSLAADDQVPLPGYWETASKATLLFTSKTVEHKCLSATDVAKFMQGPSNRHYDCTYPIKTTGGGKMRFKGQCATKKGQVAYVTAQGTYSPTTFSLKASLKTTIAGVGLSGTATTEARRISDVCPAEPAKKG